LKDLIFEIKNVGYLYTDKVRALQGVSMKVFQGEKIAILGANGSGKSTLLHVLNCLVFPSVGTVKAFGHFLTEDSLNGEQFSREFRRRVGLVFQNPDVQLFSPTVFDEIAFGPTQLDFSEEEVTRRVNDILKVLDIDKIAQRNPYNLSEGEKKKVAIASVLSYNPEVLLLDEPTAGLDPRTQAWIVDSIVELNLAGKTIITATHDLSIVPEIADRIYILGENHQVIAEGESDKLLVDEELLIRANLAHFHVHRHGAVAHAHRHRHLIHEHEHNHD
jgi:cobalt/nickel transport system ATP-binding protein